MKVKPSPKRGRVIVELKPQDQELLAEVRSNVTSGVRPFRLGKILVPVDFSECSLKALDYAVAFARQFGAELFLLHVVPVGYTLGEFGALDFTLLEADMRQNAEQQLEALGKRVGPGVTMQNQVRLGRPVLEIIEMARSSAVDLIIISTHGHTGLKHVFLGSVAENVVRYAPCPVLTVREHEHEFLAPPSTP